MLGYVVPVHQLFHQHKVKSDYSISDSNVKVKNYEKPCCKPIQFLKDTILTANSVFSDTVEFCSVISTTLPEKPFQSLFFITNKAPPIIS